MSRLSPAGQDTLFRALRTGKCPTPAALRALSDQLFQDEQQGELFEPPPPPTREEQRSAVSFEQRVEKVAALLRAGIVDNEIVAVGKISPTKADSLADLVHAMQVDLRRIELGLRRAAVDQPKDLLDQMAAE